MTASPFAVPVLGTKDFLDRYALEGAAAGDFYGNCDFVDGFDSTVLNAKAWNVFTGYPGGNPYGRFVASNVVMDKPNSQVHLVSNWKTVPIASGQSVATVTTAGIAVNNGLMPNRGLYLVCMKKSGGNPPAQVDCLWELWPDNNPANNAVELDGREDGGQTNDSVSATLHWGPSPTNKCGTLRDQIKFENVPNGLNSWSVWGMEWETITPPPGTGHPYDQMTLTLMTSTGPQENVMYPWCEWGTTIGLNPVDVLPDGTICDHPQHGKGCTFTQGTFGDVLPTVPMHLVIESAYQGPQLGSNPGGQASIDVDWVAHFPYIGG